MGCIYCRTGLNMVSEFQGGYASYLWIQVKDKSMGVEVHHKHQGDSYLDYVKIKYCPMCKREL